MSNTNPEHELTDQEKRENIPTRDQIPTAYKPLRNFVMVVPLPFPEKMGQIVLPDNNSFKADACEGHVVDKGPKVSDEVGIGDCVTFEKPMAVGMELEDGSKFLLLPETSLILRIPAEILKTQANARSKRQRA